VVKTKTKHIAVIGSGFSGLSAACYLAKSGYQVTILEKNDKPGGRGRSFAADGFVFDMGPSWYWMPEVMEEFFQDFGKSTKDYFQLKQLDPGYRVFINEGHVDIPANTDALSDLFESIEKGAGQALKQFLTEAQFKYEAGMGKFVRKPSHSIFEFMDLDILKSLFKIQLFTDMRAHLKKYFKHPQLLQLLEFPVLFLGAKPQNTPALYSLMNHADLNLGTWYPMGGMAKLPEAMIELAESLGVVIKTNSAVKKIVVNGNQITAVQGADFSFEVDGVIGSADYHHIEQTLLPEDKRQYNEEYWESRVMSPSSLLFYVGLDTKVPGLQHHNLFFDQSFDQHAQEIYDEPQWPSDPLFYLCCPSKTDNTVAPEGHENIFLLIPVAPGLESDEELREHYWNKMCIQIQIKTGVDIRNHVVYKRSFAHEEFVSEYNSYKGNAYGLANTLMQTAFLKPKMKSKKVTNLFYAGQLTVPGPGVPPSIISGQLAATELDKTLHSQP
jgi:phytoene desaturase